MAKPKNKFTPYYSLIHSEKDLRKCDLRFQNLNMVLSNKCCWICCKYNSTSHYPIYSIL